MVLLTVAGAAAQEEDESAARPRMVVPGWAGHLTGPRARADLRSADPAIRAAAAQLLARSGDHTPSVTALLEALEGEEETVVQAAIVSALAWRGDERAIEVMEARLSDWGTAERVEALRAIGAIGGERAIRALVEWLGVVEVGEVAVTSLVRIGAPAVPRLLAVMEVPTLAVPAAHALGLIGDTRAVAPLVAQLRPALPGARAEILRALGRIGDERSSAAIARSLRDAEPAVVSAALWALSLAAGANRARPVAQLADRGTSEQRAAALEALVVMDPQAAAPRVFAALQDVEAPALLRAAASRAIIARPSPPFGPALALLLSRPESRLAAAEALARIPEGGGARRLLEQASRDSDRLLDPALALSARRHAASLHPRLLRRIHERLREAAGPRGVVLSALARDPTVIPRLLTLLRSDDPIDRARGALSARLFGRNDPAIHDAISSRVASEPDPTAFRAMATAALALGIQVEIHPLETRAWDPSTSPEALWLIASALRRDSHVAPSSRSISPRASRRARRTMRRSLRAAQPRVRAGAALALALANEPAAWRPLVSALDDEHSSVRLAAARALETLGAPEAEPLLSAHARVERDDRVRAALVEAAATNTHRAPPALQFGDRVLYTRVSTAPGLSTGDALSVDVLLPDGRWLRVQALGGGEVFVPDLPGGQAEVQVLLDP